MKYYAFLWKIKKNLIYRATININDVGLIKDLIYTFRNIIIYLSSEVRKLFSYQTLDNI